MFASCKYGKTGITGCGPGAVSTHLPEGMLGCCAIAPSTDAASGISTSQVALDVNCDADVEFGAATLPQDKPPLVGWVVVDGAPPGTCTGYQVAYHY